MAGPRAGAGHLILASRRGAAAGGAAELGAELAGLGAQVTIAACDAADKDALAALLRAVPPDRPLTAVVHAEGDVQTASVVETTVDEMAEALRPKVGGALNLDELTRDLDLSAFVLVSSIAGVWGSGGQGAYSAANAFLDALAWQRRARGLAATSVAWGPWAGAGMAAGAAAGQLRRRGIRALAPELALAALEQVLSQDETFTVVADVDWERFAPAFASARPRPLIGDLPEVQQALEAAGDGASALCWRIGCPGWPRGSTRACWWSWSGLRRRPCSGMPRWRR